MEITSKQRSALKSLAMKLEPIGQIGKGGITTNMIDSLSNALEARELIKVSVLNNSDFGAKELAEQLADALGALCVQTIGSKIVLYRRSTRKDVEHIAF